MFTFIILYLIVLSWDKKKNKTKTKTKNENKKLPNCKGDIILKKLQYCSNDAEFVYFVSDLKKCGVDLHQSTLVQMSYVKKLR